VTFTVIGWFDVEWPYCGLAADCSESVWTCWCLLATDNHVSLHEGRHIGVCMCRQASLLALQQTLSQARSLLLQQTTTAKVSYSTCETKWSSASSCGTCSIRWPLHVRYLPPYQLLPPPVCAISSSVYLKLVG